MALGGSGIGGIVTGPGAGSFSPLNPNQGSRAAIPGGPCPAGKTPVGSSGGGRYDPKTGKTSPAQCPPGATQSTQPGVCCQSAGGGGGGLPGVGNLGGGGKGGGGGTWTPGSVERPKLQPINPEAEYDPRIAEALARQTQYATEIEQGSGHTMDVLTAAQADQLEAQIAQARAAAAQAGIPFDEASFRATAQRGINASMEQGRQAREAALGGALQQQAATATAEGGERNQRLGIDLQAQQATMQDLLQRYGQDIQKYGIDAQAATSANNALLGFYSQLMGGMFNMFGNMGSMSMQNQNYYG